MSLRRREFIAAVAGAGAWPIAASAQQRQRIRGIGVMSPNAENDPATQAQIATFRAEFRKLGWVEGRNIRIDYRWGSGDAARVRPLAAELMAIAPDVIVANGTTAAVAFQQMTRTIPIVFVNVPDPLANGLVTSLPHPGGNITGFANNEQLVAVKLLELLKQIAPRVTRVAFVYDSMNPNGPGYLAVLQAAAPSLGMQVSEAPLREAADIERTIDAFAREPDGGLIVKSSPILNVHRERLINSAAHRSLPAVYEFRFFVVDGGLASYGTDNNEGYRGAAGYVDRILKGDRPGDLPVQFATKIELVINTRTAKALGLEVPLALLIRADELIE